MGTLKDQQLLEEQYNRQQSNFFYESISKKLKNNLEKLPEIIDMMPQTLAVEGCLSRKQFEMIGCLSYFVGIDFINNPTDKTIQERVGARFKAIEVPHESITKFIDIVEKLFPEEYNIPVEKLKNEVNKEIVVPTHDAIEFREIRLLLKQIAANSIMPITVVVGANDILDMSYKLTYNDMLRANSLINRQCKFQGAKAITKFMKLNSHTMWTGLLDKSLIKFDNQKLAVVYLDTMLSTKELITKIGKDNVIAVLTSNLDKFKYKPGVEEVVDGAAEYKKDQEIDAVVDEFVDALDDNKNSKNSKTYAPLADGEINTFMESDPSRFMYEVISDINKKYPETIEDVDDAIKAIFDDSDFGQHIYQFMKAKISLLTPYNFYFPGFEASTLASLMNDKFKEYRDEYKELMELTCKEIPEEIMHKLVNYVNSCIGDLILESDDQKQYLISQLIENGITTYQHLHQIMEMIESCDIIGSQISSYAVLNKYINEQQDIVDIFEKTEQTQSVQLKMAVYQTFHNWFSAFIPNSIPKDENSEDKPKMTVVD